MAAGVVATKFNCDWVLMACEVPGNTALAVKIAGPALAEEMVKLALPELSVTAVLLLSVPRVVENVMVCPTTGTPLLVQFTVAVYEAPSLTSAGAAGAGEGAVNPNN